MSQIIIRHLGQEIAKLDLVDGQEYLLGRGDDCAVVLPAVKGISRHHLKICQVSGLWTVQLMARYGSLALNGQNVQEISLDQNLNFSAPPFEISFIQPQFSEVSDPVEPSEPSVQDPSLRMPTVRTQPMMETTEAQEPSGNHEATVAARIQVVPYLRVSNKKTGKEEVIQLEGHLWVAGREANCEIQLDEGRASRRHFELSRTDQGFFITDLDSANGTLLNEEPLTPNEPWQLTSGDVIRIAGVKIIFEVRDLSFGQNLPALHSQPVPHAIHTPQGDLSVDIQQPYIMDPYLPPAGGMPAVVKVDPSQVAGMMSQAKNKRVRYAIMALIPVLLYGLLSDDSSQTATNASDQAQQSSTSPTFEQLTPEKKQAIKNSFNLAMNMYQQRRFALCIAEIRKLHEMVPSYENSRELLVFCENGNVLVKKQEEKERLEREQNEAERYIRQIVQDCELQVRPNTRLADVQSCLTPAIERAPEHPMVKELLMKVQVNEDEKQRRLASAAAVAARRQSGQRQFERAKKLYQSGELANALDAYEEFINGRYDGLGELVSEAKRDISQVRKELDKKVSGLVAQCKELLDKAQYKSAYQMCDSALKEDKSNAEAKRLKSMVLSEMRRELKSMYEDSVLEESMGNIDSAKERWKQIMDKSIPGDEYHIKSRRNLQKYGVGI